MIRTHAPTLNLFDGSPRLLLCHSVIKKAEHYRASGKTANKKWRRLALVTTLVLILAFCTQLILRQLFFFPLTIHSDSMIPEIKTGDKRYFVYAKLSQPALDDIVLVQSSKSNVEFLCRIVGVDGDKIRIDRGSLQINAQTKKNLNPLHNISTDRSYFMPEIEVRPDHVFCLNDNSRNSSDSRLHGIFPRSQILARLFKPVIFF